MNIIHLIVVIPCLFAFLTIFGLLDVASVKDWCPLPSQLKSNYDFDWTSNSHKCNNTNAKPSFFQLVLSWQIFKINLLLFSITNIINSFLTHNPKLFSSATQISMN